MHLSQRSSKKKAFIQRVATVKNLAVKRSTVNAIRVELFALIFAFVKVAKIVMKMP